MAIGYGEACPKPAPRQPKARRLIRPPAEGS